MRVKAGFLVLAITGVCLSLPAAAAQPMVADRAPVETIHGADAADTSLRVTITRAGDYRIQRVHGGQAAAAVLVEQRRAPDALRQALVAVAGEGRSVPVEIAVHEDARFRAYVRLLDVLGELNLTQMRVTTHRDDHPGPD